MRKVAARTRLSAGRKPYVVVTLEELPNTWVPELNFAVLITGSAAANHIDSLIENGAYNVSWIESSEIEPGDVIWPRTGLDIVDVAFRSSDRHHTLFLTNRCNSNCLMCSQPPTREDDGWLVDQAMDTLRHILKSPESIGITGGEPLLVGTRLRTLIDEIGRRHPSTRIELLTNGRLLSNSAIEATLLDGLEAKVAWLVPLYGHAQVLHDFVVQSPGAFEETLEGILRLQQRKQCIQLRIVLIKPVLEHLEEICEFIGRNLPFVREVALMACEPIGFALANREICETDLKEWWSALIGATNILARHNVRYLFMNAPLCSLPHSLWGAAQQSISDWKQVYASECEQCSMKSSCGGLFAWYARGWKPTKIIRIEEAA